MDQVKAMRSTLSSQTEGKSLERTAKPRKIILEEHVEQVTPAQTFTKSVNVADAKSMLGLA